MARRRMIDPSLWDDEDVGVLSDGAFRLWVACISNADDEGKLLAHPARMRAMAFRYRDDVTTADVETLLAEITSRLRSVVRYMVDGRQYIKLLKWDEYQTVNRPTSSKLPEPDDGEIMHASCMPHACITTDSLPKEKKRKEEKGKEEKRSTCPAESAKAKKAKEPAPEILEVFEGYRRITGNDGAVLTDKAVSAIRARLKNPKYNPAILISAVESMMTNEWWESRHAHQPVSWFFSSDDQVEKLRGIRPENRTNGSASTKAKPDVPLHIFNPADYPEYTGD